MDMVLRKATDGDKTGIFDLYRDAMGEFIQAVWGWDEQWQMDDFEKNWTLLTTEVIEIDSAFAGYIQTEVRTDCLYITMLILTPQNRSKGSGSRIIKDLRERAAKSGMKLQLQVFKLNHRALEFYGKAGFHSVKDEPHWVVMEQ